jgi:hypothetical protein
VPPLLASLRTSAATGYLRRNPLYLLSLAIAALICSLGIAQAILGHTFLNLEHPAEDIKDLSRPYRTAPISGVIVYRPTSVFVSDGRCMVIKLRGSILFPIAFVIFWYAFLVLVPFTFNGLNIYQNFVMNAYLWLLIGVRYRLPTMKLMAQPAKVAVQSDTRHFGAL